MKDLNTNGKKCQLIKIDVAMYLWYPSPTPTHLPLAKHKHEVKNGWIALSKDRIALSKDRKILPDKWVLPFNSIK